MAKTYRVAVIGRTGKGDYGHGIDTVWKDPAVAGRVEVVAVADENPAGRDAAVKRTGVKTAYADFREMLDKEKPEVVGVGPRWLDMHHEIVSECLRRGCHVYMEKPFVRNLEEADDLVRLSEMTHTKLAIAHQTRYTPTLPVVKKLLAEGKIGTVLELRARGKEDARGGGEDLWVLGSHIMNLMSAIAGEPTACCATVSQAGKPVTKADVKIGNEGIGLLTGDAVQATYSFKDGVTGFFASHRAQAGSPSRYGLQIFGSKGVIEFMPGYLEAVHYLGDPAWSPGRSKAQWQRISTNGIGQPETLKESNGLHTGNVAAVLDLLEAVESNRQPLCNVYEARTTVEMILAVFESHRQGRPVVMPLENRKHPLTLLT